VKGPQGGEGGGAGSSTLFSTTLSLQDVGQRIDSVHLTEKLFLSKKSSYFRLSHVAVKYMATTCLYGLLEWAGGCGYLCEHKISKTQRCI